MFLQTKILSCCEFHFFKGQTARILVEFLEVAVSCIVFLKGFYPAGKYHQYILSLSSCRYLLDYLAFPPCFLGAFERRRYMNVVVQKARHPQLGNYIHSATSELLPFIQKVAAYILSLRFFVIGEDMFSCSCFCFIVQYWCSLQ